MLSLPMTVEVLDRRRLLYHADGHRSYGRTFRINANVGPNLALPLANWRNWPGIPPMGAPYEDPFGNLDLAATVQNYTIRHVGASVWEIEVVYSSRVCHWDPGPRPDDWLYEALALHKLGPRPPTPGDVLDIADLVKELGPIPPAGGDGALELDAEGGFRFRPRQRSLN